MTVVKDAPNRTTDDVAERTMDRNVPSGEPAVVAARSRKRTTAAIAAAALSALMTLLPVAAAADLAPSVQADLYLVQTDEYIKDKNYVAAKEAMEKIIGLQEKHNLQLPHQFHFKYAQVLEWAESYAEAIESLNRYLELAGRSGPHYRDALLLLAQTMEREASKYEPGGRFRDCEGCPDMVVVPSGSFMMGSPASEEGRMPREGPRRRVTIGAPFAVGIHEVTRGEFGRFVSDSGYAAGSACTVWEGEWKRTEGLDWQDPGFAQGNDHPVVCVSWNDAQAYVRWLSKRTGKDYRLLSEAEWEYVARAGTSTARYWGASEAGQCRNANGADEPSTGGGVSCDDGHARTAPVGTYTQNAFGLYDVLGNVWEWTAACWNVNYARAPDDGSAWESGSCVRRVLRGGSWDYLPWVLRSANRGRSTTGARSYSYGFRVARTL